LVKELGALTGEVFVNEDVRVLEVPPALHNAVPGTVGGKLNNDGARFTSVPLADTM
jgi:hypothetical protein